MGSSQNRLFARFSSFPWDQRSVCMSIGSPLAQGSKLGQKQIVLVLEFNEAETNVSPTCLSELFGIPLALQFPPKSSLYLPLGLWPGINLASGEASCCQVCRVQRRADHLPGSTWSSEPGGGDVLKCTPLGFCLLTHGRLAVKQGRSVCACVRARASVCAEHPGQWDGLFHCSHPHLRGAGELAFHRVSIFSVQGNRFRSDSSLGFVFQFPHRWQSCCAVLAKLLGFILRCFLLLLIHGISLFFWGEENKEHEPCVYFVGKYFCSILVQSCVIS